MTYDTTNGINVHGTARFTYTDGNHDAGMDISIPIVGSDTITINKAADSEKIEVKVDDWKYVKKFTDDHMPSPGETGVYGYNEANQTFHPFGIGFGNVPQYEDDGNGFPSIPVVNKSFYTYEGAEPIQGYAVSKEYVEQYIDYNCVKRQIVEYSAYTTNDVGETTMIPFNAEVSANSMVQRDANGHVRTADPAGQNDAVTKSYAGNRFRYTHFIEVEFNPAPEPYVSYVLIGTITYASNSATPLTSIDQLPLNVALPIHGLFAEDSTQKHETYTATRKTRSNGTSYLDITYLYYDNSNGVTKGTSGEIVPTKFTDTVL